MPHMKGAIGVRPGSANEDGVRHRDSTSGSTEDAGLYQGSFRGTVSLALVDAPHVVPAYTKNVAQHPKRVPNGINATRFAMTPGDGDLRDSVAKLAGNEQNLYVESEAIYRLSSEDVPSARRGEAFEAALRVLNTGNREGLNDDVEYTPHQMSVVGLSDSASGGTLSRCDHDVVLTQHCL